MAESRTQTKDVKSDSKTEELPEGVTAIGYADEPKAKEEGPRQKKARERAEKVAEEQAEQDSADVEAFLAVQRGERLLRGQDGSFDHIAFETRLREERLAKAREDAADQDAADDAEAEARADEDTRAEASRLKSEELGTKDATLRH